MTEIVLASRNHKKVEELLRILESQELAVTVRSLAEFPEAPEVPETESTFVANAMLKAHAIAEFTGLPAVADDSGLCVDALNGMPGVLSARWAGGTAMTLPTCAWYWTSCRMCPNPGAVPNSGAPRRWLCRIPSVASVSNRPSRAR